MMKSIMESLKLPALSMRGLEQVYGAIVNYAQQDNNLDGAKQIIRGNMGGTPIIINVRYNRANTLGVSGEDVTGIPQSPKGHVVIGVDILYDNQDVLPEYLSNNKMSLFTTINHELGHGLRIIGLTDEQRFGYGTGYMKGKPGTIPYILKDPEFDADMQVMMYIIDNSSHAYMALSQLMKSFYLSHSGSHFSNMSLDDFLANTGYRKRLVKSLIRYGYKIVSAPDPIIVV